ncbi:MAG: RecQ family ATP-dependent DNA helicase [Desulfobacterales bacterium]|nr:RecQ family ATP-dependent DNA helicase [Desulfobacterales bacterium]
MTAFSQIDMEKELREHFGFDSFRPGQKSAIETLMNERRVLCIQPTGYGKSLLYQAPSLWVDGITLVISPLLALMRDQLHHLNRRFKIPAGSINSDQTDEENAAARNAAARGAIRILFVAPEKLDNLETYRFLLGLNVGLMVVDEAHCISTWGHDFRPSYRQIVNAVHEFEKKNNDLRVLGLTATADRRVEADIAQQLTGPSGAPLKVLRISMDRPNIRLSVIPVDGPARKLEVLEKILGRTEGSGILYCATREMTEIVASWLSERKLDVVSYHAGYEPGEKRKLQKAFMEGRYKAIAATNALGMGIDKPDIRFIVHVDAPGSITAYYQEVGRAGRDGLPAEGLLLFDEKDRRVQDHFIRSALPTREDFKTIYSWIEPDRNNALPTMMAIKVRSGLHPTRVTLVLAELVEQGLVEKVMVKRRQAYRKTEKKSPPDLSRYTNQNAVRKAELEALLRYGRLDKGCLMQTLRLALGDESAQPCGQCGLCAPGPFGADFLPREKGEGAQWLATRDTPILQTMRPKMAEGVALLNGDLRASLFIRFMQRRAAAANGKPHPSLSPELEKMVAEKAAILGKKHRIGAIIPIPSRTWTQQKSTGELISQVLKAPVHFDLLAWQRPPSHRQGELLNNDQRRDNVRGKMHLTGHLPSLSGKAILLLDDYIGSGATIKEAVRVLRKPGGVKEDIVPFTIARVRWRLGAKGMI